MLKPALLIFLGGASGAILREFTMLLVPNPADNFPLDILVANLLASFLLGLATGLYRRRTLSEGTETFLGTGIAGGFSTFSSFAYGAVVLMSVSSTSAAVALLYVIVSLVMGYAAAAAGLKLGG